MTRYLFQAEDKKFVCLAAYVPQPGMSISDKLKGAGFEEKGFEDGGAGFYSLKYGGGRRLGEILAVPFNRMHYVLLMGVSVFEKPLYSSLKKTLSSLSVEEHKLKEQELEDIFGGLKKSLQSPSSLN